MTRESYIGIGVDIEKISRFYCIQKNNSLLHKIFTKKELEYCLAKKNPAPHLAARYVGKEAVVKAVNNIKNKKASILDYKKIEIYNDASGVPEVNLKKSNLNNLIIKISLSHCRDKAIAFVIAIRQ